MNYNPNLHTNISQKPRKVKLSFSKPVAYFLSLLSGVDRTTIEDARIYSRSLYRFLPWYNALKGGGAITLGSAKKASITYTENFFSANIQQYKSKAYLNNMHAWLRLSAHEVTHLEHAKRYKYLLWYLIVFGYQYLRYGHDLAPLEIEADLGRFQYDKFISFTRYNLDVDFVTTVFLNNLKEEKQMALIDFYWQKYQLSNRSS